MSTSTSFAYSCVLASAFIMPIILIRACLVIVVSMIAPLIYSWGRGVAAALPWVSVSATDVSPFFLVEKDRSLIWGEVRECWNVHKYIHKQIIQMNHISPMDKSNSFSPPRGYSHANSSCIILSEFLASPIKNMAYLHPYPFQPHLCILSTLINLHTITPRLGILLHLKHIRRQPKRFQKPVTQLLSHYYL